MSDGETRLIPLSRGLFATVDAVDYDWLAQWKWCASPSKDGKFRAFRIESTTEGPRSVLMHRQILAPSRKEKVDHRDGDSLNNRRSNLRACTQRKNSLNRIGNKTGRKLSRFKGVTLHKKTGKWDARFRRAYLGLYAVEEDAARAYDAAAREFDHEYAVLNFPSKGMTEIERRIRDAAAAYAPPRTNTSQYVGVTWSKRQSQWIVQKNRKTIGRSHSEIEAARIYADAAGSEVLLCRVS